MRSRWFSRRALLLHVEFGLIVVGCLAGGWWQLRRALEGNSLSWFYTFEWPILAAVAIGGWWHLLHEDPAAYWARKHPDWLDEGAGAPTGRPPGAS